MRNSPETCSLKEFWPTNLHPKLFHSKLEVLVRDKGHTSARLEIPHTSPKDLYTLQDRREDALITSCKGNYGPLHYFRSYYTPSSKCLFVTSHPSTHTFQHRANPLRISICCTITQHLPSLLLVKWLLACYPVS